jgi:hypothetical protein
MALDHLLDAVGGRQRAKDLNDVKGSVSPENDYERSNGPMIAGVSVAELEGLTLYEKKCVLINREIDHNGMGKYQWYIFFLCGFGYFIDLLWAQAFGLVLSPLEQELGFPGE